MSDVNNRYIQHSIQTLPLSMSKPSDVNSNIQYQIDWLGELECKCHTSGLKPTLGIKTELASQDNPYGTHSHLGPLFDKYDKGWGLIANNGSGHDSCIEMFSETENRRFNATIYGGMSFIYKQHHNNKHSMYFKRLASSWINTKNGSVKYCGHGALSNSKGSTDKWISYGFDGDACTYDINDLGPDYVFRGLVVQVGNNSGSGNSSSEVSIRSLQLHTNHAKLNGVINTTAYRIIPGALSNLKPWGPYQLPFLFGIADNG